MFSNHFYNTSQNGNYADATSSSEGVPDIATEPFDVENASQFTEWLNQPEAGPSSYANENYYWSYAYQVTDVHQCFGAHSGHYQPDSVFPMATNANLYAAPNNAYLDFGASSMQSANFPHEIPSPIGQHNPSWAHECYGPLIASTSSTNMYGIHSAPSNTCPLDFTIQRGLFTGVSQPYSNPSIYAPTGMMHDMVLVQSQVRGYPLLNEEGASAPWELHDASMSYRSSVDDGIPQVPQVTPPEPSSGPKRRRLERHSNKAHPYRGVGTGDLVPRSIAEGGEGRDGWDSEDRGATTKNQRVRSSSGTIEAMRKGKYRALEIEEGLMPQHSTSGGESEMLVFASNTHKSEGKDGLAKCGFKSSQRQRDNQKAWRRAAWECEEQILSVLSSLGGPSKSKSTGDTLAQVLELIGGDIPIRPRKATSAQGDKRAQKAYSVKEYHRFENGCLQEVCRRLVFLNAIPIPVRKMSKIKIWECAAAYVLEKYGKGSA